jgi:nucleotide-binding universal stress UspA family protein
VRVPGLLFAPYGEPAQIALALIANADAEASEYLKNVTRSPLLEGIAVETRVLEGHVTAEILDIARDEECNLIVLCAHGHSKLSRWPLGRVAAHVARHAPVPVLIVPTHGTFLPAHEADTDIRVLVTLDGSELAEAAIPPALDIMHALAASERITIHLLQVVDFFSALMTDMAQDERAASRMVGAEEHALDAARNYLQRISRRIQQENPGVTVTSTATVASDVAKTIEENATRQPHYDFIAMATHGRGGLQRWALGSVAERVLQSTALPLLIARTASAVEHDHEATEQTVEARLYRS